MLSSTNLRSCLKISFQRWYIERGRVISAWNLANTCFHAGDKDRTLEWLEKACEGRDGNMPIIRWPLWDSLRSGPRFQDLLRRIGLPLDEKRSI
jgi:hypothetical protein